MKEVCWVLCCRNAKYRPELAGAAIAKRTWLHDRRRVEIQSIAFNLSRLK
jgi:hypothetical protein